MHTTVFKKKQKKNKNPAVFSTRYYCGPQTISQTANMTPMHKTSKTVQPIKLLRYPTIPSKSQFRSPGQQETEQLCYEHIFMLQLKNDLG